jgi:phosphate:Na+ symporter
MSLTATLAPLIGGLGLFLIGMTLMTEGLKLAAGASLRHLLTRATRTRWHGLASGVLVTALVQSSSAVTVATIGFVNAGLLSLAGALWVLFGANVGTTMTSWIVALIGLKFKIDAVALPLVGVGALLRLTGEGTRRGHLGTALAGFGLLFVGIAMLQEAFTGVAGRLELPQGSGVLAVLAQLATGIVMTVAMQSSSASMAVALTAAQTGLLSLESAAAVVIGANIGTTVTAVIAGIGATPNARRVALAHVLFNVLTAAVALLLLPWLVALLRDGAEALGLGSETATLLALFHTTFNVLGVVLMWPLGDRLGSWLTTRFVDGATSTLTPVHLDENVRSVPTLALSALAAEIARLHALVCEPLLAIARADEPAGDLARLRAVEPLAAEIDRFAESVHRTAMTRENATRLAALLRAERHVESAIEALAQLPPRPASLRPVAGSMSGAMAPVRETERQFLDALASATESRDTDASRLDAPYKACKAALLEAGALGALPISEMDPALIRASLLRRAAREWLKAQTILREPTAVSSVGH